MERTLEVITKLYKVKKKTKLFSKIILMSVVGQNKLLTWLTLGLIIKIQFSLIIQKMNLFSIFMFYKFIFEFKKMFNYSYKS